MPNTTTAKKAMRQNSTRRVINRAVYTKVANLYHAARRGLESTDDMAKVKEMIVSFESYGMSSSATHMQKKSVSSKISRLVHAFKKKFQQYA